MSKVLVEVEATLWARFRGRAVERGLKVPEAMGQALRGWLSFEAGSVAAVTGGEPPAAERGDPSALEALKRLGLVTSGRAVLDVTASADPTRGKATTEVFHPRGGGAYVPDPREVERRRRAAQDRLRTHPEDEVADPEVDF